MIEDIREMRKRHEKEIEDLQSSCRHIKISDWMPYAWAPGHLGPNIKVCKFCGKIIDSDAKPILINGEDQ